MKAFKKLWTALRGGVNDAAEAVADSQGLRILEQELRDASNDQEKAKQSLASIIAKETLQKKRVAELNTEIEDLSKKALLAQQKGNVELALEIASHVGQRTQERDNQAKMMEQYSSFAEKQRGIVLETDRRIKTARQQADMIAARESIQKAQLNVMASNGDSVSGLNSAMDSLNRIREKQDIREAEMHAREGLENETNGKSLDQKMAEAGLIDDKYSAESVLASLKAKQ